MGFVLVVGILKLKGMNYLILLLLLPESWLHHHHHLEQEEQGHQAQQEDSDNPESQVPVLFSVQFPEKVSRCYAGNVHTGSQCCPGVQQQNPSILNPVHCLQHWRDVKRNKDPFTLSINNEFGVSASALTSCLISYGFNPFLEQLA